MSIANQSNKGGKVYFEDFKKSLILAKHQLNLEKLHGYKIQTELDLKLCLYLGKVKVPGVTEKLLQKNGLLVGGKLVGVKLDGNLLVNQNTLQPVILNLQDDDES